MKKLVGVFALFVGFCFASNSVFANTTTISSASSTAVTVTGTAGILTVTTSGVLTVGTSTAAVTLNASNPSTVNISNSGTINQNGTADAIVDAGGHMTITVNNGSTTNSSALIETSASDTFHLDHATNNVTLNNYGSVISLNTTASTNQAINWSGLTDGGVMSQGSNALNNFFSGLIQATNADAVRPGVNGTINNSGTIKSTTTNAGSDDAIDAETNSGVVIVNAASATNGTGATNLIEGAKHAITGGITTLTDTTGTGTYTMSVTNNLGGTIQGDNGSGINIDGYNGNEMVTIVNAGTITGHGVTGDGDGVDVDGLVNLTNTGTIHSIDAFHDTSEGVTVGGGTIVNSGLIEGSATVAEGGVGRGITLAGIDQDANKNPIAIQPIYGVTSVHNELGGVIKGDTDSGITIRGVPQSGFTEYAVTITNDAGASIIGGSMATGTNVAAIEAGLSNGDSAPSANNITIVNGGTIDGSSDGKAIEFGSGNGSLQIVGGSAQVLGNIIGGSGTNTVSINTGSGQSFNYAGTISNVSNVSVAAKSNFAAGGVQNAPVSNGTTNAANGNATIDTTNFVSGTGTTPNTILNITNATLTFALGSGDANSGSNLIITGPNTNTVSFAGANVASIDDLVSTSLSLNEEYVLIEGNSGTDFTGLELGQVGALGQQIVGGLTLQSGTGGNTFSNVYGSSALYLVGNNIDVEVSAPEPSTWVMLICGLAGVGFFHWRRRSKA